MKGRERRAVTESKREDFPVLFRRYKNAASCFVLKVARRKKCVNAGRVQNPINHGYKFGPVQPNTEG